MPKSKIGNRKFQKYREIVNVEIISPHQNPMLIDLVVKRICQSLEIPELLNFRLVCKKWSEMATHFAQRYGPLISFSSSKAVAEVLPKIQTTARGKAIVNIENSNFVLCEKLVLNFCTELGHCNGHYHALMDMCLPNITYLELTYSNQEDSLNSDSEMTEMMNFFRIMNLKTTLMGWISKMPALEILKIPAFSLYDSAGLMNSVGKLDSLRELSIRSIGGDGELTSSLFDELFKMSRRLRRLSLELVEIDSFYAEEILGENGEVIREINHFRRPAIMNVDVILKSFEDHGNIYQLKDMKFNCLSNGHLTSLLRLATIGLRLNSFKLTEGWIFRGFPEDMLDSPSLVAFLNDQPSLTKLVISPIIFRQLTNQLYVFQLLELELYMTKIEDLNDEFQIHLGKTSTAPAFCFSLMFPNLTSLTIRGSTMHSFVNEFFLEGHEIIPCTTLKHLRLPPGKFTSKESIAEKLSQLFPNITSLDVRLPKAEFLHGIWKFWPGLVNLNIVCVNCATPDNTMRCGSKKEGFSRYLDHGFTGIKSEIGYQSQRLRNTEMHLLKTKPSIADLENLKHLTLNFSSIMKPGATWKAKLVSDMIVYEALMKMPQLKEIIIKETLLNFQLNEGKIYGYTSDLSLEVVEDLRWTLNSTKVQVTSTRIGKDWAVLYKSPEMFRLDPNELPQIHVKDIADFDEKSYKILAASSLSGKPSISWKDMDRLSKCNRKRMQLSSNCLRSSDIDLSSDNSMDFIHSSGDCSIDFMCSSDSDSSI